MIDMNQMIGPTQTARKSKSATSDTAANYMTELSWLVEELQEEIDTLDACPYSLIHARLVSDLTTAIVKRTILLRLAVRETMSHYQDLRVTQDFHGGTK